MNDTTNTMLKLEQEFISTIKDKTLAELSIIIGHPLDNLTALIDFVYILKDNGIKYMFNNKEFLDLPIKAHYSYNDEKDIFVITHNRAIIVESGYCTLSFISEMPEYEVKDSNYKTVRDILPLINYIEE